jgi:hypothetical protein
MKMTGGIDERRLLLAEYECNRYKYFIPSFDAERFARKFGAAEKRIYLLMAGNGYSKTSLAINIVANIIWPTKNRYIQGRIFEQWDYPKNFWYLSKHTTLKNAVNPEIKKWFPKNRYNLTEREGYPIHLETDVGFTIDFLRYDQNIDSFESATVGLIIKDEPCIEKIYNACISRLRMGGLLLWIMTPLLKAGFVKNRILEGNEYACVHTGSVWDNSIKNRGVLKESDIEFMISQYSPEERDARVDGKLMLLVGLVFKEFDRNRNVIKIEDIERLFIPQVFGKFEEWPKVMVIDPHDRKADFIFWAAMAPDGTWIIYDEHPDKDFWEIRSRDDDIKQTLRKCIAKESGNTVKQWKALSGGNPQKIYRRIMDRRKGAQNVSDAGQNLRDLYIIRSKEIGQPMSIELSFDDQNKIDHKPIAEMIKSEISEDGFMIKRPKLLILSDCTNTIKGFENYSWDDWNAHDDDKKPLREQVVQKYKHPIDCVRYLVGENIKYEHVVSREVDNRDRFRNTEKRGWMAA